MCEKNFVQNCAKESIFIFKISLADDILLALIWAIDILKDYFRLTKGLT